MKKLAILFLLTTVLIGGVFAQSVKANVELANVSEANDGKRDIKLALIFAGSGSQEVGPGALTFALQVAPQLHFISEGQGSTGAAWDGDDNFGQIGYGIPAGPGTLDISLKLLMTDAITWRPAVGYLGLVAGPATLGFGAYYDFKTTGQNEDRESAAFGKYTDGVETKDDDVAFWVTAGFDFGLNVKYEFKYGIGGEYIKNIAYLDVNYAIMEALVAGVELDSTGAKVKDGDLFDGVQVKPYVNYTLNENVSAGAYFKLQGINNSAEADLEFAPGVWIQYAL